MAIIKCTQCGQPVSDKAEKCPHCGKVFALVQNEQLTHERPQLTVSKSKKKWLISCIVIGLIAASAFLWFPMSNKHEEKPLGPTQNVTNTQPVKEEKNKVYSNCYDGYLNIREAPRLNAPIIGTLRNGPEGATLLSKEGDWTKIECKGVVGYVYSKYVQETPTIAYTGSATFDQIAGVYDNLGISLFLYFDGTYWIGGEASDLERGRYILQNNEVKLMPVYSDFSEYEERILPIDAANKKVGNYKKQPFLTESEISKAKTKYGEDWFGELYMDDYAFAGTLKDFKKLSALK